MNMDKNEIRRGNLWSLRQSLGKGAVNEIAEKADTSPSYLSTVFNGQRDLGDELAERIETVFDKPKGWLDISPDFESKDAQENDVNLDVMRIAIKMVAERNLSLSPDGIADLCIAIYQWIKKSDTPKEQVSAEIIKLIDVFGKTA